jgi:nicotinamide riboside kinase
MTTEIIVLTGPESCGKSTLSEALARYWQAPLVPEAARHYLEQDPSYTESDLLTIARLQQQLEADALTGAPARLVCDTDLLVIMIWSEVKYGRCDPWITETFEANQQMESVRRRYCLCDYHMPWQSDPLRENPDNRHELFTLYQEKLDSYKLHYVIAKGNPQERLQQTLKNCTR